MKIYERCVLFMSDKNDKLDRVRVTFTISKEVADYYRELSKRFSVPYSTLMAMHLSQGMSRKNLKLMLVILCLNLLRNLIKRISTKCFMLLIKYILMILRRVLILNRIFSREILISRDMGCY